MEPKYITLEEAIEGCPPMSAAEMMKIYDQTGWLYYPGFIQTVLGNANDQSITEDIECEIIEPKRLPSSE